MRTLLFALALLTLSCGGPSQGEACDIEKESSACASGQVYFCACPIEGTGDCPEDASWNFDESCTCTSDSDIDCT